MSTSIVAHRLSASVLAAAVLGCCLATAVLAQSSGVIVGVAQDSSGAVIPGVQVRAVNERTGLEWSAQSDQEGRFSFPRLPVGDYRVEAVSEGFRTFSSERFRLDADQSRQVTVTMEVGQVTETVTVTGAVALVETVGGTLKEVVDERRITELPLNGRNPVQLVQLVPGVVTGPGASGLNQNEGLAVNGSRAVSNNFLLDGGDNNDPQHNVAALNPNPDALEEFSVQTNNFSAEYGRNMGAVINAVTKSGTNQLHGSLYEFLRNDALDARNFFALETGKLRRNQFGGTVGGPIVKNKTFFFVAYEGLRERVGETFSSLVVPTQLERAGDFSATTRKPRDPHTNAAFPGDIIPATQFDPASVNFLRDLEVPLPNSAGNRFVFNRPQTLDANQYMIRLDHNLSSNHRLTGRVFRNDSSQITTAGLPALRSESAFDNWNVMGQHTWTASPSLIGIGQFSFNQTIIDRGPLPIGPGEGVSFQSLGVNVNRGAPDALGVPLVPHFRGQVNGFWNLAQDNLVRIDRQTSQVMYSMSYTRGAHMFKFGGEYRYSLSDRVTGNGVDPQFTFNGQISNNPFSDFLLGRPFFFTQGSLRINAIRADALALFAQDDWKIHPRFTLSLGLRWEPFLPFYSADNELTIFRPGQQSTAFPAAPPGMLYQDDAGVPRGGTGPDLNNLAPRVSFAWTPYGNSKTSVRGGYGIFYDTPRFHQLSHFVNSPPYSMQLRVNQPQSFSDPYAGQPNPFPYVPPQTEQERADYTFLLPVNLGLTVDPRLRAAYNQQWNFNIQRELAPELIFTAAYVGSKATRLPIRRELNPAAFGPGATAGNIDGRRLFAPNFASIINYESTINSTYNSMQLSLNKRFSQSFTLLAHYTVGKTIDGASIDPDGFPGQDPLNLRADKGLAQFDVRQRFVASFLWELPGLQSGPGRWILGGWQTNGIFTAQSGTPFTVVSGRDIALAGVGSQRPNLVSDPRLDTSRPREQLIERYFDPNAFALPAAGTYGNFGRNVLAGPGSWNLDFALFKKFRLAETSELQFRWEMFNAFNHANLGNPRSNITAADPGMITSASAPRIMQFGLRIVF